MTSVPLIVVVSDCLTVLLALVATVMAFRTWQFAHGRPKAAWAVFTMGLALWCLGEAVWGFYEVFLEREAPFPSLADVFYLAPYPLFFVGTLMFAAPARRVAWLRTALDAAAITFAILAPVWLHVLKPIADGSSDSSLTAALTLAYPVFDLLVVFAVAVAALRPHRGQQSSSLTALSCGLIAFIASDFIFALLSLQDDFGTGTPLDLGWMAGYALFATAAYAGGRELDRPEGLDTALRSTAHRQTIPLIVLACVVAWALYEAEWGVGIDPVVAAAVVLMVGLVIVRSYVTTTDILRVTDELEETRSLLEEANSGLQDKSRTLNALLTEAVDLSRRDSMTGLLNHGAILEELDYALRGKQPVLVLLMDVDHMKTINDQLGHQAGDAVLVELARAIKATPGLVGGRYGGDEFLAFIRLTSGDPSQAASGFAGLLGGIATLDFSAFVSMGWAAYPQDGNSVTRLVGQADDRLYEAKRARPFWQQVSQGRTA